jgi:uncharacterized protein with HEPN domain
MQRDPRAWLWDIQQAGQRATAFLHSQDLVSYQANDMLRAAVERQFEIIGEAISQLAKHAPELAAQIPSWREAIGFRNILIHGYATIDDARVWQIAQVNLPALMRAVDRLIDEA